MPPERSGRGKFPKLVPDHILSHIYRYELTSVVDGDRQPHEIRGDHRGPGPGLDDGLFTRLQVLLNLLFKTVVNVWSFF